jgi:hypothetical protein
MKELHEILHLLGTVWSQPREVTHRGKKSPFFLKSDFAVDAAEPREIAQLPFRIPEDLKQFWLRARSAALFRDVTYGQWGIEVMDPLESLRVTQRQAARRPSEFMKTDLVVGRFMGDSDLLLLCCASESESYGSVRIALPIDKRSDWPIVATSLTEFFDRLVRAEGDKYWEVRQ